MHLGNILLATLSTSLPVALTQRVFAAPISLVNSTYRGTGCPANSVTSTFNSDLLSLQFNATRYAPSLGQGIGVAQNQKNCQIRAEILVPTNYSLTIWQNRVFGAAQLTEGVTAQFLTTVYLSSGVQVRAVSIIVLSLQWQSHMKNIHLHTTDHFIPSDTEGACECSIC